EALEHHLQDGTQLLLEAGGDVLDHTSNLEVAGVEPLARGHLEEVDDQLALAQAVPEHRDRAEVQRARREPEQMGGDAVELEVDDAQVLRALGHLNLEL